MSYKQSPQYSTAVTVYALLDEVDNVIIHDLAFDTGHDCYLESEDLTTEQMMRKALNLLADKLAHKIKWREQQNKLDND